VLLAAAAFASTLAILPALAVTAQAQAAAPLERAALSSPQTRQARVGAGMSSLLVQEEVGGGFRLKRHRRAHKHISLRRSSTEPYWACPEDLCEAIVDPRPVRIAGRWKAPEGGPAYEGSGEFGGLDPEDLRSAYKIPTSGGSTQTIALVDAYGYPRAEEDLARYRERYGLPACTKANGCFKKINQLGEEANYPSGEGWELETALDVDMASAACPSCHIMLVEANSNFFSDFGVAVNTAAALGATEISNSYGLADEFFGAPADRELEELNVDYDHPGIMITAAAGDSGYDGEFAGTSSPWFPASSPNVVSVGGTSLRKASNARGWSEEVWLESGRGLGSGGGCSVSEPKPAWQTDTGCAFRTDNDVAAVGSCETPVSVALEGGWWLVCGTSAASPLVAGIEAHASAFARSLPGAEAFYSDPSAAFDVTAGSSSSRGCEPEYLCTAEVGYDGPTGVGAPDGPLELTSLPPIAATTAATAVAASSATLNGSIDPQGVATTYHFEYGTSTAYGTNVPVPDASAGAGSSRELVSEPITGLQANTTYHYRLTASSANGTSHGEDSVFRTGAPSVSGVAPDIGPARGGSSVTISGANFAGASLVKFGATKAKSFSVISEGSIHAVSPSGSGTVDVTVTTPAGTTPITAADRFHYERPLWAIGKLPRPAGAATTELFGVSCAASEWCMGVGRYQVPYTPYSEIWNGKEWTEHAARAPVEVEDVGRHETGAGSGSGQFSGDTGVAVDAEGNLWVADSGNHRVQEMTASGKFIKAIGWGVSDGKAQAETCTSKCQAGIAGTGNGQFKNPFGIAIAPNGTVWVSDSEADRVQEFSSAGEYLGQLGSAGSGEGQLNGPQGVAIGSGGNVWVVDAGNDRLEEFAASGAFIKQVGSQGAGNGQFSRPAGIAVSAAGDLWVADAANNRVEELSSSGEYLSQFATTLPEPQGIALDTHEHVWVIDGQNEGRLQEFSASGQSIAQAGGGGNCEVQHMYYAWGVAVAGENEYTSDPPCSFVQKWTTSGEGSTPTFSTWFGGSETIEERHTPTTGNLAGVSCASQNACEAVGEYVNGKGTHLPLAERWNGSEWSLQPVLAPAGAKETQLSAVSCSSASSCMAVGWSEEANGVTVPFAVILKNGTWSVETLPTPPEGGTLTNLYGISCPTASSCMAVGRTKGEAGNIGSGTGFAESWNGTSWSIASPAKPAGEDKGVLSSVSCTSPGACFAVGQFLGPHPPSESVYWGTWIERWNGSGWSEQPYQKPGQLQDGLGGVSCTTPESCFAVGTYEVKTGLWEPYEARWNGSSWSVETMSNNEPIEDRLGAVSCVLESTCASVGYDVEAGYGQQFAETRAETTMGLQAAATVSGVTQTSLSGSSCVSSTACIDVGSSTNASGTVSSLAFAWNGSEWLVSSTPNPSGATVSELRHVSCTSATSCTAVGSDKPKSGKAVTLAERLTGSEWSIQTTATPSKATESQLSGVSCTSATSCTAVGRYKLSSGGFLTLAEAWNGSEWTVQSTPNPSGATSAQLTSVSCSSASACTAVGSYVGSAGTASLVERWNGSAWQIQSTPSPSGASATELSGVSCWAASACTAVGSYVDAGATTSLAEAWNGSEWKLEAIESPAGAVNSEEQAVSCTTLGACTAVGTYHTAGGAPTPLAELWNGEEWRAWSAPAPAGAESSELADISCVSTFACEAAGTYTSSGKAHVALTEGLGAPGASTGAASGVSETAATLTGSVTANQWATTYHIEYGPSESYGHSVPVPDVGLISEAGESVSQRISGLTAGTTYHFRLVASNVVGTTYGKDRTFTTARQPSYTTSFGTEGTGAGQLKDPVGVAVDGAGNVWVADAGNDRVEEFSSTGTFTTMFGWGVKNGKAEAETCTSSCKAGIAGSGNGQFKRPAGIAIAPKGEIWVVDAENSRVEEFSSAGKYLRQFGSSGLGEGQFVEPSGVAVDASGDVWVADPRYYRVEEFSAEGKFIRQVGLPNGHEFATPVGVAVAPSGNLWVTDSYNSGVAELSASGGFISEFGTPGDGEAQFDQPAGLAVDAQGNIWVVDSYNQRVEELSPTGEYLTQLGSGGGAPGFWYPWGVAVAGGSAYVADSGNNRIQKWTVTE
jgi:sugar lactone lactonase YvrE